MTEIFAGLSMMPEDDFRESVYPVFEEGIVDWIEWSFDMGWGERGVPSWLDGLLSFYGSEGRLSGHGVQYSAMSDKWTTVQDRWLENLKIEVASRQYAHISEHFGFARAGDYTFAAPFPVPLCKRAVETGQENLQRIHRITGGPVGIENLAMAFGTRDVEDQGRFLDSLVAPINGFLVLDIHNIHCQSINFGIPILELIQSYPLERVMEIHISGGSFSESKMGYTDKSIRRDTHDGPVPSELFTLLPDVLKLCPNAKVVLLERLGNTFSNKASKKEFANEFRDLKKIVSKVNEKRAITGGAVPFEVPFQREMTNWVRENTDTGGNVDPQCLEELQSTLFMLLADNRKNAESIKDELKRDKRFTSVSDYIDSMELRMLEVGQELIKKWGVKTVN
ncbi:MAG: DUF692 family protein [Candidatus Melainabacteria bacterium]|nr:DUF692 family protein [Candidatus Melainabacteria bacterium]